MVSIKIPTTYDDKAVLVADDEPEHVEWLCDYLKARGFEVTLATNVRDAVAASERQQFRLYVIDLNIPLGGWDPSSSPTANAYTGYQGLHIIQFVRTQGNAGRRVVAYSAHYNEQIVAAIKTLYCEYVIKGRPQQLKQAIHDIIQKDPQVPRRTKVPAKTAAPNKATLRKKSADKKRSASSAPANKRGGALKPQDPKQKRSAKPVRTH
jgi:CheY-like chemotaxis protein